IKLGICGEHGGDPSSVEFCHQLGLDYVSCSPYRVAIARLAAAHAALAEAEGRKGEKATRSARSGRRRSRVGRKKRGPPAHRNSGTWPWGFALRQRAEAPRVPTRWSVPSSSTEDGSSVRDFTFAPVFLTLRFLPFVAQAHARVVPPST